MIPSPNLDDRHVHEIFETALARLTQLYGDEIDTSYQDPGVALLELFALLKDMQHYYLNHVDDAHRRQYAQLLGCLPQAAQNVRVPLVFASTGRQYIPKGYPVQAGAQTFETLCGLRLSSNSLGAVLTGREGHLAAVPESAPFYPFGRPADRSHALYIGLTKDPGQHPPRGLYLHRPDSPPLAVPLCRLFAEAFDGRGWTRLDFNDGTRGLRQSGYWEFEAFPPMEAGHVEPHPECLYWIRVGLAVCDFALAPSAMGLWLNTIPAAQIPDRGACGHVRRGMVNSAADRGVWVNNPCAATGSAREESLSERMDRTARDYGLLYRAVTAEDYRRLLTEQSPLPLEAVLAHQDGDGITLYVKPKSDRPLPALNEAYRQNLLDFLEPYRLLTARVRIEAPVYRAVSIRAALSFCGDVSDPTERIVRHIHALWPPAEELTGFTERLMYGELYGHLASLPFVRRVVSLELECGDGNFRSGAMDLPAGTMVYTRDIDITQVREIS